MQVADDRVTTLKFVANSTIRPPFIGDALDFFISRQAQGVRGIPICGCFVGSVFGECPALLEVLWPPPPYKYAMSQKSCIVRHVQTALLSPFIPKVDTQPFQDQFKHLASQPTAHNGQHDGANRI